MSSAPHYALAHGTRLTIGGTAHEVLATEATGYRTVDISTNLASFISFGCFAQALKLPGLRITPPENGKSTSTRLKNRFSAEGLSADQKEIGRFRVACCEAVLALERQLARESGAKAERLSGRDLDDPRTRSQILAYVRRALGG